MITHIIVRFVKLVIRVTDCTIGSFKLVPRGTNCTSSDPYQQNVVFRVNHAQFAHAISETLIYRHDHFSPAQCGFSKMTKLELSSRCKIIDLTIKIIQTTYKFPSPKESVKNR